MNILRDKGGTVYEKYYAANGKYYILRSRGNCQASGKMAAQGWMLESRTNFTWHYRRITPDMAILRSLIFRRPPISTPSHPNNSESFQDFCAQTAGVEACRFPRRRSDLCERGAKSGTHGDGRPGAEVQTIHKAMKRTTCRRSCS